MTEPQIILMNIEGGFLDTPGKCPKCPPPDWNGTEWFSMQLTRTVWDVELARTIIREAPRPIVRLNRDVADAIGLNLTPGTVKDYGYNPHWPHLDHIPDASLKDPVIFAPLPQSGLLMMIDGTHRSVKRFLAGEKFVEAVELTIAESARCIDSAVDRVRELKLKAMEAISQ